MARQLTKPQVRFPAVNGGSQQQEMEEPLLTSEGTKHTHDKQIHMQALKHKISLDKKSVYLFKI